VPDLRHEHFTALAVDLEDLDGLAGWLGEHPAELIDLDAAVLCAGRGLLGGLEEQSFETIRRLIDLDLTAQIFLTRAVVPSMKRRGQGDVILMGSEAALAGGRRGAVYSAAKFGLRGFAQAMRQECARSGVRLGIVHPGVVRTPFFDGLEIEPGDEADEHLVADDVADAVVAMLGARVGAVFDEVVISPQKRVVRRRSSP
jgi:short-subunit dehydrogenase